MIQNTDGTTKVCGILGDPVGHSLSPLLQNLFAVRTGVNLSYVPFHVKPRDLESSVRGAFGLNISGLNVTVPHKQSVIQFLDSLDDTAKAVGAVNTLVRTGKGFRGYNTDVAGLTRTVKAAGISLSGRDCILIGAGGAAKAAIYMMAREGASRIYVLNRNLANAEKLAGYVNERFDRRVAVPLPLSDYGKIPGDGYFAIQSTSVGMRPMEDAAPVEDEAFYQKIREAVDVIYTPVETKFMKYVRAAGGMAVNGLDMLLYQGAASFELWNPGFLVGADAIEEARQLILERLCGDSRPGDIRRSADAAQNVNAMAAEEPVSLCGETGGSREDNLILIGFMGAGKTSVGKMYAKKYGIPVLDTDVLIEVTSGMSISTLFASQGEEVFRKKETQMLENLLIEKEKSVKGNLGEGFWSRSLISTGGGLPLREENRKLLRRLGTVIYLKVKPATVLERLSGDTSRPLLQGENVEERVKELLAFREPLYEEAAHGIVEVDKKSYDEIIAEIEAVERKVNQK